MILALVMLLYFWRLYINRNPHEGMTEQEMYEWILTTPIGKRIIETTYYTMVTNGRT